MTIWKKQTTRNGETIFSKRFYGTLKTSEGRKKQVPLTEDEASSEKLLKLLQSEQIERKLNGTTSYDDAKEMSIHEILEAYLNYLATKENTSEYLKTTRQRLEKLIKGLKAKTIDDIDSTRIMKLLSDWRGRKKKSISIGTANHYVVAIKSLSKFLQRERMTSDDRLIALRKMNSQTDRRRIRRPLSLVELDKLCGATQIHNKYYLGHDWSFSPDDRVMLYRLAAFTGLRANELASLTISSFDLCLKTFTIEAQNAKNRKKTTLPLHPLLCDLLPKFFKLLKTSSVFPGSWTKQRLAGKLLKRDLKRAKIDIQKNGTILDFHSLRYTFITNLAKSGVHPSKAQRLARHSSIVLTMNVYTQMDADDLRDAVNSLPS